MSKKLLPRNFMEFDAVIVGVGPGLGAAIRLKQIIRSFRAAQINLSSDDYS